MKSAVQEKIDSMWPIARWGIGITVPIICACLGWMFQAVNSHELRLGVHENQIRNMDKKSDTRREDDLRQMDKVDAKLNEIQNDIKTLLQKPR